MPRFRKISEILRMMKDKTHVRNIGIIAHIDHGKTTMSDSLLAEAGLLSPTVAGEARALDYLEEEQKRGITIKTANISLLHVYEGEPYVINLIDTPGHVDFSGKVTRALRAIDGCLLLVDAVEEFMVMSEVRLRKALEERVKPILFINKVDRLIKELKLTPEKVQEKFIRIINQFNNLIETYGEPEYKDEWKARPAEGTVIFGSALHRWGFTIPMMQKKGLKFSDIVKYYKDGNLDELRELLPLHEAVLDVVVKHLPNPLEAQPFRIPKIWKGDLDSPIGQAMMKVDDDGPTVICVSKITFDPHAGVVSAGRIFSGTIKKGDEVYLVNAATKYKIPQVSIYMGPFREVVDEVPAGNFVALLGLDKCRAGETIVDAAYSDQMVPFEPMKYISEPVLTIAVEPKHPRDLPRLIEAMKRLSIEDPNLVATVNQETGEYLLSGMGELHLEIACKTIQREFNVEITTSEPTVVYRETVRASAGPFMGKSPNKHNKLWFTVEPLEEEVMKLISEGSLSDVLSAKARREVLVKKAGWSSREARDVITIDPNMNILVDCTTGVQYLREVREMIGAGFRWACEAGPLAEEPIRGIKVKLVDAQLHEDPVHRGPAQIMPATRQAIFAAFLSARPTLLEPIYKIQIRVPPQHLGGVTSLITRKRGSVFKVEQRGPIVFVEGYIPVSETIGLASEMRSATSGTAFWQCTFSHWAPVPDSMLPDLIRKIRMRKGLKPEPPRAEQFIVRE